MSLSKATAGSVATTRAASGTTLNHEPTKENRPAKHTSEKQTKDNSSSLSTNQRTSESASKVVIRTGMPFPPTLTKMAHGCGLDSKNLAHEWRLFVEAMRGSPMTSNELRARLKEWLVRPASTRRSAGVGNACAANGQPPEFLVVGNMDMQEWTQGLACGLEEDDCLFEWRKWTLHNHGKTLSLVAAQTSWSGFATNARQYLVRKGVYYSQQELRELRATGSRS